MKLLLDTHVLLWCLDEYANLSPAVRDSITDNANEVFVSAASVWEIAIKRARGKLEAPADLEQVMRVQRFTPLLITFAHAQTAGALPPIHADPFDRMLIAQAKCAGLTLVTRDQRLAQYDVALLLA